MLARIFRPAKTAMQSGRGLDRWVLEYEPEVPLSVEPLMGYTSSADMKRQVRLDFQSAEQAVAYAEKHGIPYQFAPAQDRVVQPASYADNFSTSRPTPWTH